MHNAMIRVPLLSILATTLSVAFCDAVAHADTEVEPSVAEISDNSSESSWPLAMRDRPLTLGRGMFSAGASVDMASRFDSVRLGLGGLSGLSYGVSDALTLGVSYDLGLAPSEGKGPVTAHAGYTFYSEGALILTATGSFSRDLLSASSGVGLGLLYWYNLGDKLSLFGGGDQINASLDPLTTTMSLPLALGYQLNAHSFVSLGTELATLVLQDEGQMLESSLLGRDALPLGLTGTFSPNSSLDLFLSLNTDAKETSIDALSVGVGAIYYGSAR
jgi:hypothetical protein